MINNTDDRAAEIARLNGLLQAAQAEVKRLTTMCTFLVEFGNEGCSVERLQSTDLADERLMIRKSTHDAALATIAELRAEIEGLNKALTDIVAESAQRLLNNSKQAAEIDRLRAPAAGPICPITETPCSGNQPRCRSNCLAYHANALATWKCKANPTAIEPQDCDWPTCGCDPYASKVLTALDEAGLSIVRAPAGDAMEAAREAERWINRWTMRYSTTPGHVHSSDLITYLAHVFERRDTVAEERGRQGVEAELTIAKHCIAELEKLIDEIKTEDAKTAQAGFREGIEMAMQACLTSENITGAVMRIRALLPAAPKEG